MSPPVQNIVTALANRPTLVMQKAIASMAKNYSVLDENQQLLCGISLDSSQNVTGEAIRAIPFAGKYVSRGRTYTYRMTDASGALALEIRKGEGTWAAQFDVVDPVAGGTFGSIRMNHGFMGGMQGQWVSPTGEVLMQTEGNVVRREYQIVGPQGAPIGKVRHKVMAVHDLWQLDLAPGSNHLYSAIFAAILDFEKEM